MNRVEHLLVCLAEEGSEISQATDKALRFGLWDSHPKRDNVTNFQDIVNEINDLLGVIELLEEEGIPLKILLFDREAIEAKKTKVKKYMEYARECGTLE